MAEITGSQARAAGLGHNAASLIQVEVAKLRRKPGDPKRYKKADVERARPFVSHFSHQALPVVVNFDGEILCGAIFVEAARAAGITKLRVVQQQGLSEQEQLLFAIATNKLTSLGSWDIAAMDSAVRDFERHLEGFAPDLLGFPPGELDRLLGISSAAGADDLPAAPTHCVSRSGSLWAAGGHRITCGSATDAAVFATLMATERAAAAISDPPFGCKIDGFVSKRGKHKDFVQAAGEMSAAELLVFFRQACVALHSVLAPGALVYLFIDWRSLSLLQAAAEEVFGKIINLCVWAKDRAGMGSFYRSRHELVLVLAAPGAKHRNNIELGRHGRDRSNVWEYPAAASSRAGREGDMLKHHPTPKPVEMISDAILDCTRRGEIVVDSFLGSGTTLIAAERTGRRCYGVDLAPHFVDLAIRRWQAWTGEQAVDEETGQTFNELEARMLGGDAQ